MRRRPARAPHARPTRPATHHARPHAPHQADAHLGPHPDAPPDLPEPLASVLAAHWGEKILATFTAAAAFSTLKDAGDTLNIHRSSLLRTIRNVEAAVGVPVLTDHSRTAPLHLTPTGRRLLRQAEQYREVVAPIELSLAKTLAASLSTCG